MSGKTAQSRAVEEPQGRRAGWIGALRSGVRPGAFPAAGLEKESSPQR